MVPAALLDQVDLDSDRQGVELTVAVLPRPATHTILAGLKQHQRVTMLKKSSTYFEEQDPLAQTL